MNPLTVLFEEEGISLSSNGGGIHTLCLNRGQNVINPEMINSVSKALDVFETQVDHPKALIVLGEQKNKFFSNGLDLRFLQSHSDPEKNVMIQSYWKHVLARLLIMDCRTVAAINGHAFGAGLFLALACDYRVMRTKRGFLNWPELNLGMKLAKGFAELTKAKVTDPQLLREGVLTGKRYTSGEALARGLIDAECSVEDLLRHAHELARAGLPKQLKAKFFNPKSFQMMKIELYTDAYRALTMAKADTPSHSRL